MRSISCIATFRSDHVTDPKVSTYTERPSIMTSMYVPVSRLKPRIVTFASELLRAMVSTPGRPESSSGSVVAPESRISSAVITETAPGESSTVFSVRVAIVTTSSSRNSSSSSGASSPSSAGSTSPC
jgi:hypothetical protein